MITPKQIEKATMNENKRKEAHNNIFAFYIGRPLSYVLTIPFLYTSMSPNTITFISMIVLVIGTVIFMLFESKPLMIIGWLLFFLWNLLDGVDGNVARYKKQFSKTGDLWDTTAGYLAMVTTFMSAGIGAFRTSNITAVPNMIFLIMGGWTAIFSIFPRLVLHKKKSSFGETKDISEFRDKNSFSLTKVIALNLISVTGFLQVIWLLAIIFDFQNCFICVYFILNFVVMVETLCKLLKE